VRYAVVRNFSRDSVSARRFISPASRSANMPAYVVKVRVRGIEPVTRHFRLDEVIYGLGFLPWRPGIPPEDEDIGAVYSQWEYAGNHPLNPEGSRC
jgi:hypothetical protein